MTEQLLQGLSDKEAKRTLASIVEISAVDSIPGADRIQVATVKGWKVVIKKDEYVVGDRAVYFEIDSFLPVADEYSFIGKASINPITRASGEFQSGIRLRTVKLRGQVSQGLLMPFTGVANVSDLSDEELASKLSALPVGSDVTELLGVTKWERPEVTTNMGQSAGGFPSEYVDKTDEERIQNLPKAYSILTGEAFYGSSKYDGTSTTIVKDGEELIFASRNLRLKEGSEIEAYLDAVGVLDKLKAYSGDLVIQGEFYGEGIQGNPLGIIGRRHAVFNIHKGDRRLGLLEMIQLAGELGLELPEVSILGSSDESQILEIKAAIKVANSGRKPHSASKFSRADAGPLPIKVKEIVRTDFHFTPDELLALADRQRYDSNNSVQEGIVFRPLSGSTRGNIVSFKAISNKFLMKHDA